VSTLVPGSGIQDGKNGSRIKNPGSTTPGTGTGTTQEKDPVLPVMQCIGAGDGPRDLLTELPKTTKLLLEGEKSENKRYYTAENRRRNYSFLSVKSVCKSGRNNLNLLIICTQQRQNF
jgi:hypothetical protein